MQIDLKREEEAECDLVLKNAYYADVFCGKIRKGDIAITGDRITGIGEYCGRREIDCCGLYVTPALIDGHVHIESAMLPPERFAAAVVPRGTLTVIADPHEIANVCGLAGVEYLVKAAEGTPLHVKMMLPSCVPATPFEHNGATLSSRDIAGAIGKYHGLGEFMDYPAVCSGDGEALAKLAAAARAGKVIDGHAPALTGKMLDRYLCGGISTDHECLSGEEIEEKISKGMYVHIRGGSSARNLSNAKYVTPYNFRRFLFCTDDCHCADLFGDGGIAGALKKTVAAGLDPVTAVACATLNAAECYGLKFTGGIGVGWYADLAVFDSLANFNCIYAVSRGKVVAERGKPLFDTSVKYLPQSVLSTVHVRELAADDFKITLKGERARAILPQEGGLYTKPLTVRLKSRDGDVILSDGILKLAVVERHKNTGNIGKGFLAGYGFRSGAMATTVSHDSHNIVVLGDDNAAMAKACNRLKETGGGMAICASSGELYSVALDIAGLMTSAPAEEFVPAFAALTARARAMGVKEGYDPFMTAAFLALGVIPEIRLLDGGLFDVGSFSFVPLEA